jgi:hypothetical protein
MAYMPQRGFSGYQHTGNWTWEFYPPPYDFLAPGNSRPMPPFVYPARGVGGCGCGGSCGGGCYGGLGLFDSGLDVSQWGLGEWAAVAVGVYVLGSLVGDTRRAGRRAGRAVKSSYRSVARAATKKRRAREAYERVMAG